MVVRIIKTDEDYIVDLKKGKKYYQFKFRYSMGLYDFLRGYINSTYNFSKKVDEYIDIINSIIDEAFYDTDTVFVEIRKNRIDILYFVKDNMFSIYFMI